MIINRTSRSLFFVANERDFNRKFCSLFSRIKFCREEGGAATNQFDHHLLSLSPYTQFFDRTVNETIDVAIGYRVTLATLG